MPTVLLAVLDELLDLGDGLARHDHARHAVGALAAPAISTRASRWPSVATARSIVPDPAASMVWKKMPLR